MPRKILFKILSFFICFLLLFEQSGFAQVAGALDISGHLAQLHNAIMLEKFRPLHLRYLSYDGQSNNFKLLLDKGDIQHLKKEEVEDSTQQLLKYFFIGVSLPRDAFWVNLRPDSPEEIIDARLAQTDIGKILLEADVQLKKDTAKLTSPDSPTGREYWDKLYKKAEELLGAGNISIPTLVRPWIVPGEILIGETSTNAYIYKATLKVMLEEDYLSRPGLSEAIAFQRPGLEFKDDRLKELNKYSAQLVTELILPQLTKEINTSKRYAKLRQVYYSLILAQWFKSRFANKPGLYPWLIEQGRLQGLTSKEAWSKNTYFQEYQKSFKNGEYNFQEPVTTLQGRSMRSYFSGGIADLAPLMPQPASGKLATLGVTGVMQRREQDPAYLATVEHNAPADATRELLTAEDPFKLKIKAGQIGVDGETAPTQKTEISPNITVTKEATSNQKKTNQESAFSRIGGAINNLVAAVQRYFRDRRLGALPTTLDERGYSAGIKEEVLATLAKINDAQTTEEVTQFIRALGLQGESDEKIKLKREEIVRKLLREENLLATAKAFKEFIHKLAPRSLTRQEEEEIVADLLTAPDPIEAANAFKDLAMALHKSHKDFSAADVEAILFYLIHTQDYAKAARAFLELDKKFLESNSEAEKPKLSLEVQHDIIFSLANSQDPIGLTENFNAQKAAQAFSQLATVFGLLGVDPVRSNIITRLATRRDSKQAAEKFNSFAGLVNSGKINIPENTRERVFAVLARAPEPIMAIEGIESNPDKTDEILESLATAEIDNPQPLFIRSAPVLERPTAVSVAGKQQNSRAEVIAGAPGLILPSTRANYPGLTEQQLGRRAAVVEFLDTLNPISFFFKHDNRHTWKDYAAQIAGIAAIWAAMLIAPYETMYYLTTHAGWSGAGVALASTLAAVAANILTHGLYNTIAMPTGIAPLIKSKGAFSPDSSGDGADVGRKADFDKLLLKLKDQNPNVRRQAIKDLGDLIKAQSQPEVFQAIIEKCLRKSEYYRKMNAASAKVKDRSADPAVTVEAVNSLLAIDQDREITKLLEEIEKERFNPEAMRALINTAVNDKNERVREAAILILGEVNSKELTENIYQKLKASENQYVRAVVLSLFVSGVHNASVSVDNTDSGQLSLWRRVAVGLRLEKKEISLSIIGTFMKASVDKSWRVRHAALSNLARIDFSHDNEGFSIYDIMAAIVKALEDQDWHVRGAAALALGRIKDYDAQGSLLNLTKMLQKALESINRLKNLPQSASQMKELEERYQEAIAAVEAINSKIGNGDIIKNSTEEDLLLSQVVPQALNCGDPRAEEIAISVLGKIKGPEMISVFKEIAENDVEPYKRVAAIQALALFGSEEAVVPVIAARLSKDNNSEVRAIAAHSLGKIAVAMADQKARDALSLEERARVGIDMRIANLLKSAGINTIDSREPRELELAEEGISALIKALDDSDLTVQGTAVSVLAAIGYRKAVLAIGAKLNSEDSLIRRTAVAALGALNDKSAIPYLEKALLGDSDPVVRRWAVHLLAVIGGNTIIDIFKKVLASERDPLVRQDIVVEIALLSDGKLDQEIMQEINVLLSSADPRVREVLIEALSKIEGKDALALFGQVAVSDPDVNVRVKAVRTISRNFDPAALPILIDILDRGDSVAREEAAYASSQIEGVFSDPALLTALIKVMSEDWNIQTRKAAALALSKSKDPRAIGALVDMMVRDRPEVAFLDVADILSREGRLFGSAEDMLEHSRDLYMGLRAQIVDYLGEMEETHANPEVNQGLIKMLGLENDGLRAAVARALGKTASKEAVEPLVALLASETRGSHSSYGDVLENVADALARIKTIEAVSALIKISKDSKKPIARIYAIQAMGLIPETIAVVAELAQDGSAEVRVAAAKALGRLGTKEAVGYLRTLSNDNSRNVVGAAVASLRSVAHLEPGGEFNLPAEVNRALIQAARTASAGLGLLLSDSKTENVEESPESREASVEALLVLVLGKNVGIKSRQEAIQALGVRGHAQGVPALIGLLTNDILGEYAEEALVKIGEPAIAILKANLEGLGFMESSQHNRIIRALVLLRDRDTLEMVFGSWKWDVEIVQAMAANYKSLDAKEQGRVKDWLRQVYKKASARFYAAFNRGRLRDAVAEILNGIDPDFLAAKAGKLQDVDSSEGSVSTPREKIKFSNLKEYELKEYRSISDLCAQLINDGLMQAGKNIQMQQLLSLIRDNPAKFKKHILQNAKVYVPLLAETLSSENSQVREFAYKVLGDIPDTLLNPEDKERLSRYEQFMDMISHMKEVLASERYLELADAFNRMRDTQQVLEIAKLLTGEDTLVKMAEILVTAKGSSRSMSKNIDNLMSLWLAELANKDFADKLLRESSNDKLKTYLNEIDNIRLTLQTIAQMRQTDTEGKVGYKDSPDKAAEQIEQCLWYPVGIWVIIAMLASEDVPFDFKEVLAQAIVQCRKGPNDPEGTAIFSAPQIERRIFPIVFEDVVRGDDGIWPELLGGPVEESGIIGEVPIDDLFGADDQDLSGDGLILPSTRANYPGLTEQQLGRRAAVVEFLDTLNPISFFFKHDNRHSWQDYAAQIAGIATIWTAMLIAPYETMYYLTTQAGWSGAWVAVASIIAAVAANILTHGLYNTIAIPTGFAPLAVKEPQPRVKGRFGIFRAQPAQEGSGFEVKKYLVQSEISLPVKHAVTQDYALAGPIHLILNAGTAREMKLGIYRLDDALRGIKGFEISAYAEYAIIDERPGKLAADKGFKGLRSAELVEISRNNPGRFDTVDIDGSGIQIQRDGGKIKITNYTSAPINIGDEYNAQTRQRVDALRYERAMEKVRQLVESLGGEDFFRRPFKEVAAALGAKEIASTTEEEFVTPATPYIITIDNIGWQEIQKVRQRERYWAREMWSQPWKHSPAINGPGFYYCQKAMQEALARGTAIDSLAWYHEILEAFFGEEQAYDEFFSLPANHFNLRVVEETLKLALKMGGDIFMKEYANANSGFENTVRFMQEKEYPETATNKFRASFTEILGRMQKQAQALPKDAAVLLRRGEVKGQQEAQKVKSVLKTASVLPGEPLRSDFSGDLWIEAGTYSYRIRVEQGIVKMQRYLKESKESLLLEMGKVHDFRLGTQIQVGSSRSAHPIYGRNTYFLEGDEGSLMGQHFRIAIFSAGQNFHFVLSSLDSAAVTSISWDEPVKQTVPKNAAIHFYDNLKSAIEKLRSTEQDQMIREGVLDSKDAVDREKAIALSRLDKSSLDLLAKILWKYNYDFASDPLLVASVVGGGRPAVICSLREPGKQLFESPESKALLARLGLIIDINPEKKLSELSRDKGVPVSYYTAILYSLEGARQTINTNLEFLRQRYNLRSIYLNMKDAEISGFMQDIKQSDLKGLFFGFPRSAVELYMDLKQKQSFGMLLSDITDLIMADDAVEIEVYLNNPIMYARANPLDSFNMFVVNYDGLNEAVYAALKARIGYNTTMSVLNGRPTATEATWLQARNPKTSKFPGADAFDEDIQTDAAYRESLLRQARPLETAELDSLINEARALIETNEGRAPPEARDIEVRIIDLSSLGIPRFKGADSLVRQDLVLGSKQGDKLILYVSSRFYNEYLKNNPLLLADRISHEQQELLENKSHAQATQSIHKYLDPATQTPVFFKACVDMAQKANDGSFEYLKALALNPHPNDPQNKLKGYVDNKGSQNSPTQKLSALKERVLTEIQGQGFYDAQRPVSERLNAYESFIRDQIDISIEDDPTISVWDFNKSYLKDLRSNFRQVFSREAVQAGSKRQHFYNVVRAALFLAMQLLPPLVMPQYNTDSGKLIGVSIYAGKPKFYPTVLLTLPATFVLGLFFLATPPAQVFSILGIQSVLGLSLVSFLGIKFFIAPRFAFVKGHELTHIYQYALIHRIKKELNISLPDNEILRKLSLERTVANLGIAPPSKAELIKVAEGMFEDMAGLAGIDLAATQVTSPFSAVSSDGLSGHVPDLAVTTSAGNPQEISKESADIEIIKQIVQEDRKGLEQNRHMVIESTPEAEAVPSDAVGLCGLVQSDLARRIRQYLGERNLRVILHLAEVVFDGDYHAFVVISLDGKNYLLDTTLRQFTYEGYWTGLKTGTRDPRVREALIQHPEWQRIIDQIIRDGFIELNQEVVDAYSCLLRAKQPARVEDLLGNSTTNPDYTDERLDELMPAIRQFSAASSLDNPTLPAGIKNTSSQGAPATGLSANNPAQSTGAPTSSDNDGMSGLSQIGKNATGEILPDGRLQITADTTYVVALESKGKLDAQELKSRIESLDSLDSAHKAMLFSMLDLLQAHPPQLYSFSVEIADFFGKAIADKGVIVLQEKLFTDDLDGTTALLHELGHYLVDAGLMRLKFDVQENKIILDIPGQPQVIIELSSQVRNFIAQEKWDDGWQKDTHYILRILQRAILGEADKELSSTILNREFDRRMGRQGFMGSGADKRGWNQSLVNILLARLESLPDFLTILSEEKDTNVKSIIGDVLQNNLAARTKVFAALADPQTNDTMRGYLAYLIKDGLLYNSRFTLESAERNSLFKLWEDPANSAFTRGNLIEALYYDFNRKRVLDQEQFNGAMRVLVRTYQRSHERMLLRRLIQDAVTSKDGVALFRDLVSEMNKLETPDAVIGDLAYALVQAVMPKVGLEDMEDIANNLTSLLARPTHSISTRNILGNVLVDIIARDHKIKLAGNALDGLIDSLMASRENIVGTNSVAVLLYSLLSRDPNVRITPRYLDILCDALNTGNITVVKDSAQAIVLGLERDRGLLPSDEQFNKVVTAFGVKSTADARDLLIRALGAFIGRRPVFFGRATLILKEKVGLTSLELASGGYAQNTAADLTEGLIRTAPAITLAMTEDKNFPQLVQNLPGDFATWDSQVLRENLFRGLTFKKALGRTVIYEITDSQHPLAGRGRKYVAFKLLKAGENPGLLTYESQMMDYLKAHQQYWGLRSRYPEVVNFSGQKVIRASTEAMPEIQKSLAAQIVASGNNFSVDATGGRYTLMAYTVSDMDYFTYLNDALADPEKAALAEKDVIHDLCVLARRGIVHKSLIELFHTASDSDREDKGRFLWMAGILRNMNKSGAGRLHAWNKSVLFPNERLSGLADLAELALLEDIADPDNIHNPFRGNKTLAKKISDRFGARTQTTYLLSYLGDYILSHVLLRLSLEQKNGSLKKENAAVLAQELEDLFISYVAEFIGKPWDEIKTGLAAVDFRKMAEQIIYIMASDASWAKDYQDEKMRASLFETKIKYPPSVTDLPGWVDIEIDGATGKRLTGWYYELCDPDFLRRFLKSYRLEGIVDGYRLFKTIPGMDQSVFQRFAHDALFDNLRKNHPEVFQALVNNVSPDLGPFNGPLVLQELIKALYITTGLMLVWDEGLPVQAVHPMPAQTIGISGPAVTVTGQALNPDQNAVINQAIRDAFAAKPGSVNAAQQLTRAELDSLGANMLDSNIKVYMVPGLSQFDDLLVAHPGRGGEVFNHALRQIYLSPDRINTIRSLSSEAQKQFWIHEAGHLTMPYGSTEEDVQASYPLSQVLTELKDTVDAQAGEINVVATQEVDITSLGIIEPETEPAWQMSPEAMLTSLNESLTQVGLSREARSAIIKVIDASKKPMAVYKAVKVLLDTPAMTKDQKRDMLINFSSKPNKPEEYLILAAEVFPRPFPSGLNNANKKEIETWERAALAVMTMYHGAYGLFDLDGKMGTALSMLSGIELYLENNKDALASLNEIYNKGNNVLKRLRKLMQSVKGNYDGPEYWKHELNEILVEFNTLRAEFSALEEKSLKNFDENSDVGKMRDTAIGLFVEGTVILEDRMAFANGDPIKEETLSLAEILRSLVLEQKKEFNREIKIKSRNIQDVLIKGNRLRIMMALKNILDNAVVLAPKYSPEIIFDYDGRNIVLMISDKGPGIPRDKWEKRDSLGRPQVVWYGETERPDGLPKGTGFGLAETYWVLREHGGSLDILPPEPNKGASFILKLPAVLLSETFTAISARPQAIIAGPAITVTGQALNSEQNAAINQAIKDAFAARAGSGKNARMLDADMLRLLGAGTLNPDINVYIIPGLSQFDNLLVAHPGRGGEAFNHSLRHIYLSPARVRHVHNLSPESQKQFWEHEVGHLSLPYGTSEEDVQAKYPVTQVLAEEFIRRLGITREDLGRRDFRGVNLEDWVGDYDYDLLVDPIRRATIERTVRGIKQKSWQEIEEIILRYSPQLRAKLDTYKATMKSRMYGAFNDVSYKRWLVGDSVAKNGQEDRPPLYRAVEDLLYNNRLEVQRKAKNLFNDQAKPIRSFGDLEFIAVDSEGNILTDLMAWMFAAKSSQDRRPAPEYYLAKKTSLNKLLGLLPPALPLPAPEKEAVQLKIPFEEFMPDASLAPEPLPEIEPELESLEPGQAKLPFPQFSDAEVLHEIRNALNLITAFLASGDNDDAVSKLGRRINELWESSAFSRDRKTPKPIRTIFKNEIVAAITSLGQDIENSSQPSNLDKARIIRLLASYVSLLCDNWINEDMDMQGVPEAVSLNSLISDIVLFYKEILNEGSSINFSSDQSNPEVKIDPRMLVAVLINLVKNAMIASDGDRKYWIQIHSSQENGFAKISVQDKGNGIRAKDLPFIFEAGFTTNPAKSGHGWGLYLVKGMIEAAGGRIECVSKHKDELKAGEESGTTFTIYLPAVEKSAADLGAQVKGEISYLDISENDKKRLSNTDNSILKVKLAVCLAVAAWNVDTGERVMVHILPNGHEKAKYVDRELSYTKEYYFDDLLSDISGPQWRVAVVSSLDVHTGMKHISPEEIKSYLEGKNKVTDINIYNLNKMRYLVFDAQGRLRTEGSSILDISLAVASTTALDKKGGSDGSTSSADSLTSDSQAKELGGIDLRSLPLVAQPMIAPLPGQLNNAKLGISLTAVPAAKLDKEWAQIQNMVNAGVVPSPQRIREYLNSSCNSPDCQQRIDKALGLITRILRIDEDRVSETDASLKSFLVLLEANKPVQEVVLSLNNVTVEETEPISIN